MWFLFGDPLLEGGSAGGGTGFFLDIVDLLGGEAGAIADLIYILSRGLQVCTLAVSAAECCEGGSDTGWRAH